MVTDSPSEAVYCSSCGSRVQADYCSQCGTPVRRQARAARPPESRDAAQMGLQTPRDKNKVTIVGVLVVVILVVAAALFLKFRGDGTAQPPSAQQDIPTGGGFEVIAIATASCMRPGSRDSTGRPTTYEPQRAVDGVTETAWRCDGTGIGESLILQFSGPVAINSLGIVPGLAKTDPGNGADRYAQNRRISAIEVSGENAGPFDFQLDTSKYNRSMQYMQLPKTVITRSLKITILASVPGEAVGGQAAGNTVAIAEVRWN